MRVSAGLTYPGFIYHISTEEDSFMYSTNKMLALQVRTKIAFDRMIERVKPSERGQTAVEYAGIAFVVALVAGVLITKQGEIADEILKKIKEALTKIH
ncbi:hypothetical protein HMPREF9056_02678 [Actinomyces sp. oral taxon 170 str. F0386]|nr:hypothetical protein HMPREF9056_02678 [Actinomyces sp. oral taxon 170 str. F0386]